MFEKLKSYAARQLELDPSEITPDSTFESLGIDSLDVGEMIMDLESEGIHHIMELAGENFGGKITDYSARFFGLCEDCLRETAGTPVKADDAANDKKQQKS